LLNNDPYNYAEKRYKEYSLIYCYINYMSEINNDELNIRLLQNLLKSERQNNTDLLMENEMLRKSLEFYKRQYMNLAVDEYKDVLDIEMEIKNKDL